MQINGYDISTLGPLLQPRDRWKIDEEGISCSRTILALYANWFDSVPNLYEPHPFNAGVQYRSCSCEQEQEFGDLCLVTLLYDQRYTAPTTGLPQSQFGVNGAKLLQDIKLHVNFKTGNPGAFDANAPWQQFWDTRTKDWNADLNGQYLSSVPPYLIGWTKFPDASATVWTKVYFNSLPTDPIPQGRILDPGFGFGPSGCYLVNTCDQQKENAFWCRTTHFDYFPNGVPTQIFQNA